MLVRTLRRRTSRVALRCDQTTLRVSAAVLASHGPKPPGILRSPQPGPGCPRAILRPALRCWSASSLNRCRRCVLEPLFSQEQSTGRTGVRRVGSYAGAYGPASIGACRPASPRTYGPASARTYGPASAGAYRPAPVGGYGSAPVAAQALKKTLVRTLRRRPHASHSGETRRLCGSVQRFQPVTDASLRAFSGPHNRDQDAPGPF
jgi:hypothetical protein